MLKSVVAALCLLACAAAQAAERPFENWDPFKISDKKKPTRYQLVEEGGRSVLHAVADASASGLTRSAPFSIVDRPLANWSWKVSRLIASADNSKARYEDSPVRLVMAFDGDTAKLPRLDQAALYISRKVFGREMPYATLMYIWANKAPVGSVIENPHTSRVQMVVASSGAAGVGAWQNLQRDVLADFRRAFKEEPGRVLYYGVMSDTDNTGESVEAWYGEIEFQAAARPRPAPVPAGKSKAATK
jgi:hypothetical protein